MKAVENEEQKAKELEERFQNEIYIHARVEKRTPRSKKITTEGVIEICPGDENDTFDLIMVRGENRYHFAHLIANELKRVGAVLTQ